MPYNWPAFSSKRRINSICRSAWSSCSLLNSEIAAVEAGATAGWRSLCSTILVCATAIQRPLRYRGSTSHSRNRLMAEVGGRRMVPAAKRLVEKVISKARARFSRPSAARMRGVDQRQCQVVGVGVIEQLASALIEHIGVDAV